MEKENFKIFGYLVAIVMVFVLFDFSTKIINKSFEFESQIFNEFGDNDSSVIKHYTLILDSLSQNQKRLLDSITKKNKSNSDDMKYNYIDSIVKVNIHVLDSLSRNIKFDIKTINHNEELVNLITKNNLLVLKSLNISNSKGEKLGTKLELLDAVAKSNYNLLIHKYYLSTFLKTLVIVVNVVMLFGFFQVIKKIFKKIN